MCRAVPSTYIKQVRNARIARSTLEGAGHVHRCQPHDLQSREVLGPREDHARPAALKLHSVFPSTDGARGTCLWEAQSVDAVKQFVETLTSAFSRNEYMVVEAANAMGLPR